MASLSPQLPQVDINLIYSSRESFFFFRNGAAIVVTFSLISLMNRIRDSLILCSGSAPLGEGIRWSAKAWNRTIL